MHLCQSFPVLIVICCSLGIRGFLCRRSHVPGSNVSQPPCWLSRSSDGDVHPQHCQTLTLSLRGGGRGSSLRKKFIQKSGETKTNPKGLPPIQSETQQRQRRHMTVLLVGSALMNDQLQVSMLLPMIHSLVTSPPPLGVPDSSAEIAMGIFFAAKDLFQLLTAPLAGALVARTSSHRALLVSTAALGVATLVFSQATTFAQLLMARAAQGAASAAVLTGGLSLIAETHPTGRGTAMGLAYAGLALGTVTGPLLGGVMYSTWGRQTTFQVAGIVVLLNAVAQFIVFEQQGTATIPNDTVQKQSSRSSSTATKQRKSTTTEWTMMKRLLHNTDIMVVAASILVIHAVLGVMKPLSQVVLANEFDMNVMGRSMVISIATVTYLLSTPAAGRFSDILVSRSFMVVVGLALMSASAVFFGLRTVFGLPALYVSVALLGTALGVSSSASQALLADLVDTQNEKDNNNGSGGDYSMAFALSDMLIPSE